MHATRVVELGAMSENNLRGITLVEDLYGDSLFLKAGFH